MSDDLKKSTGLRASEMWVGMRTVCGDTSMVLGVTVAGRTHVFLAAREVVQQLADQIVTVLEAPISRPHEPRPRSLSLNGADRRLVAGLLARPDGGVRGRFREAG